MSVGFRKWPQSFECVSAEFFNFMARAGILARPSSKTLVEWLYEKCISGYHHLQCPTFGPLVVQVRLIQGRKEGGRWGKITEAQDYYGTPNHCRRRGKVQTILQVLSSIQHICFGQTSASNMWTPNLLLPRVPPILVTPLGRFNWFENK